MIVFILMVETRSIQCNILTCMIRRVAILFGIFRNGYSQGGIKNGKEENKEPVTVKELIDSMVDDAADIIDELHGDLIKQ